MPKHTPAAFNDAIDFYVLQALSAGIDKFDDLISVLPGVYPSVAISSLNRLLLSGRIKRFQISASTNTNPERCPMEDLPPPHPLHYSWCFTENTVERLLAEALKITSCGDSIVLLGTPTLLRAAEQKLLSRRFTLFDSDRALVTSLRKYNHTHNVRICDLEADPLPDVRAQIVIADPPWYEDEMRAFLWAGRYFCVRGGTIFLSFPPLGTRPGIPEEWNRLATWAEQLGLVLSRYEKTTLSYISPVFEQNALLAEGVPALSADWRRGDLAVFSCSRELTVSRPPSRDKERWHEEIFRQARIRIRQGKRSRSVDPTLLTVVEGNILPSVSRRDSRRPLADIWTSGNRIFKCNDSFLFQQIASAVHENIPATQLVNDVLRRTLTDDEARRVCHAERQLKDLIAIEEIDYRNTIEKHVALDSVSHSRSL